jgi:hypothetical protein
MWVGVTQPYSFLENLGRSPLSLSFSALRPMLAALPAIQRSASGTQKVSPTESHREFRSVAKRRGLVAS